MSSLAKRARRSSADWYDALREIDGSYVVEVAVATRCIVFRFAQITLEVVPQRTRGSILSSCHAQRKGSAHNVMFLTVFERLQKHSR